MRSILATLVALALCAVTINPLMAGLTVNGYTQETAGKYDRFANDENFIGNAFDWSGVGRTSGGRWGVLISPSFVLSSRHFPPRMNEQIRFYHTNDPKDGYVERSFASSLILADSDLVLTRLAQPTTGVATYAIGNPTANIVGQDLFVWGQADNKNAHLNMRLGRNEVMQVLPDYAPMGLVGQADVITYDYNTLTGLGPDEAKLASQDSGGPSFIIGPDGPELVGIHWFVYNVDSKARGLYSGSGDTLVSSFVGELNSAMLEANSWERVTVAAVPEPGAIGLVLAGLSLVFVRRRQAA